MLAMPATQTVLAIREASVFPRACDGCDRSEKAAHDCCLKTVDIDARLIAENDDGQLRIEITHDVCSRADGISVMLHRSVAATGREPSSQGHNPPVS